MEKFRPYLKSIILLIIGSAISAISINGILIPKKFISGGLTGASMIIYYLNPTMTLGVIYMLINIPVFLLGWYFVNLRFIVFTSLGMLIFSIMLYFFKISIPIEDKMLATIVAGCITGVGTSIMLKSYGSSGGSEIIAIIFNKFFSITLGTGMIIINALIMAVSIYFFPIENVFYTLIYIVVTSKVTDKIFHGLSKREVAIIISDKWIEILESMKNECHIKVTVLNGKGGYCGADRTLLYTVINRHKAAHLKKIVTEKDPAAFIAIMEASDVTGVEIGNQPHW